MWKYHECYKINDNRNQIILNLYHKCDKIKDNRNIIILNLYHKCDKIKDNRNQIILNLCEIFFVIKTLQGLKVKKLYFFNVPVNLCLF